MAKILTAFFSMSGETYADGGVINLEKGFTHMAAEFIQEAVGGDMFRIEQVRVYSTDHFKMIQEAKEELNSDARPELKRDLDSLEDYDTVFLGFPNWWNTLPMPVVTFLTRHDFTGKRIIPFNTNGGGGFGKSLNAIEKYAGGAQIAEGLTVHGTRVEDSEMTIKQWAAAQA